MVPGSHRALCLETRSALAAVAAAAAVELGLRHGGGGARPRLSEGLQRKKPGYSVSEPWKEHWRGTLRIAR